MAVFLRVPELLSDDPLASQWSRSYRAAVVAAVLVNVALTVLATVPDPWDRAEPVVAAAKLVTFAVMAGDYALRMVGAWLSADKPTESAACLKRYLLGTLGGFDAVAVLPAALVWLVGLGPDAVTVCGLVGVLKLVRYSPALETLGAVLLQEIRPLTSALLIMMLLALCSSTLLYFVERGANPQGFGSIPQALWWSVVTLTTLGYGDVVPTTVLGKLMGGCVAVSGLCMFALPASILASGFAEEMRKRSFLSTWSLVAKVPFFSRLSAHEIAEVASLLRLYHAVRGEILMREGEPGTCMYFIIAGAVEVASQHGAFVLRDGDFFGEIAILHQAPRTATVQALSRCQLLVLEGRHFQRLAGRYPEMTSIIARTARERMGGDAPGH